MKRRRFLSCLLLLVAACGRAQVVFHNTELKEAGFGRRLVLADHHGQLRSLDDFRGKAIVVFFGYTSCPDICPTMLSRLASVMTVLGADAGRVQVLFVSVDPERDSAARLAEFVPWFHPSFLGLHGDAAQTRAAIEAFRVVATRKPVDGEMGYVIDHSAGAYIYGPDGRLRLYAQDTASVEDIAADLRALLNGA